MMKNHAECFDEDLQVSKKVVPLQSCFGKGAGKFSEKVA